MKPDRISRVEPYALSLILVVFGLVGLVGVISPKVDTFVTDFALALGVSPLLFSLGIFLAGVLMIWRNFSRLLKSKAARPGFVLCSYCSAEQPEEIGRCQRCGKVIHLRAGDRPGR